MEDNDTIITQATINSTYYINNKQVYSSIDSAWENLLNYVAAISRRNS